MAESGKQSDGSVYYNSDLGFAIENDLINMPAKKNLPNSNRKLPYVFTGDDAFGHKPHIMTPYPKQYLPVDERIFNYRLSRARRIVENAFGIATTRFRIFRRPIIASVERVIAITMSVVALHNFLLTIQEENQNFKYCTSTYVDRETSRGVVEGEWRAEAQSNTGLLNIPKISSNNYSLFAGVVRDQYKEYFNKEGAVDWQWDKANCTSSNLNEQ